MFSFITLGTIETASKSAWGEDRIIDALGTLGDTPYMVNTIDIALPLQDSLFFRVKDLKQARREAVAMLTKERCKHGTDTYLVYSFQFFFSFCIDEDYLTHNLSFGR